MVSSGVIPASFNNANTFSEIRLDHETVTANQCEGMVMQKMRHVPDPAQS